jgi:hypothetical protein
MHGPTVEKKKCAEFLQFSFFVIILWILYFYLTGRSFSNGKLERNAVYVVPNRMCLGLSEAREMGRCIKEMPRSRSSKWQTIETACSKHVKFRINLMYIRFNFCEHGLKWKICDVYAA